MQDADNRIRFKIVLQNLWASCQFSVIAYCKQCKETEVREALISATLQGASCGSAPSLALANPDYGWGGVSATTPAGTADATAVRRARLRRRAAALYSATRSGQ